MKIIVLGCGPSGLLAAHAARLRGYEPEIISHKRKSPMPGTMHLHRSIPELTDSEPEFVVDYVKVGTPEGYAAKVYGSDTAPVSFRQFDAGLRTSWSMRSMYDRLWATFEDQIVDQGVTHESVMRLVERSDLVISSIPRPSLCYNHYHYFRGQKVWLGDTLPSDLELPDNTVVYNGSPLWSWYRASRIDGYTAIESTKEFPGAYSGVKPLNTKCDCFPEVKRVGRFGVWHKGILSHDAFSRAFDHIEEAERVAV